jgi:hypothetical protein
VRELTCAAAAGGAGGLARYKEWRHRMMFDDDWEVTPTAPVGRRQR